MIKDFPAICGNEDKIKQVTSRNRENLYKSARYELWGAKLLIHSFNQLLIYQIHHLLNC